MKLRAKAGLVQTSFQATKPFTPTRAWLGTVLPISTKDKALQGPGEGTGLMEEL